MVDFVEMHANFAQNVAKFHTFSQELINIYYIVM